jgi:hypothetical protein
MNDPEIERSLRESPPVERGLVDGIQRRIAAGLKPVRPLEPRWILSAELIAAAALVGFAGAWRVGLLAVHKLTPVQAAAIFSAWAVVILLAAGTATAAMIPGARQWMRPAPLVAMACVVLAGAFAVAFSDYSTDSFVKQGIICLKAGLADAIPAGVLVWLIMRRGFAVSGSAAGAVAGLAGFFMLELHCPLFEAPHAMVWHVAVIPVSAAAGAVGALFLARRRGGAE